MIFRIKRILIQNGPLSTYKIWALANKEQKCSLKEVKDLCSDLLRKGQIKDCGSISTGYLYKAG